MFLENLQIAITKNKDNLTLKNLIELYGEDYIPPYFIQNYGGRIYPLSEFWKNKFVELDNYIGLKNQKIKNNSKNAPQGCSRTWLKNERKEDKRLLNQIFKDER